MDQPDAARIGESLWRAIEDGDWDTAADLMHDDYVQEWPQSRERIVGRDNALAVNRNFPGGVPKMALRASRCVGDLAVTEYELTYADGSVYEAVSILEVRDGKVARETDYFAEPFPAPQWRAQWRAPWVDGA
jgi:ketosteroid isomerase-like protein